MIDPQSMPDSFVEILTERGGKISSTLAFGLSGFRKERGSKKDS